MRNNHKNIAMEKEKFQAFVDETRSIWRKIKEEISKDIPEDLKEYIEEMLTESNKETGDEGEDAIEKMVISRGYITGRTANSETPSDVWAIKRIGDTVHIGLIQSKATKTSENPESLSNAKKIELRMFSRLVLRLFLKSDFIPQELKDMKVIVSNGYLGIVLDDKKGKIVKQEHYSVWSLRKHQANEAEFKKIAREFYNFK